MHPVTVNQMKMNRIELNEIMNWVWIVTCLVLLLTRWCSGKWSQVVFRNNKTFTRHSFKQHFIWWFFRKVALKKTHHVHQGHVKEHASGDGENPACDVMRVLTHGCADHHAEVGHESRQQVVHDGLLYRHTGLQQHRKVTYGQNRGAVSQSYITVQTTARSKDDPECAHKACFHCANLKSTFFLSDGLKMNTADWSQSPSKTKRKWRQKKKSRLLA